TALALPVDDRWRHPAPDWSLAVTELRPATHGDGRWRSAALIGVAAALVWIIGLNLYVGQMDSEARALKVAMQGQVTQAFPDIGIVIDPLKQAQQRRYSLRAAHGSARDDDFLPLAQAAASLLPQAAHRVE
ncbi:MAG: general secretion pathway protein GspL, partial [Burkholderiaceae bacterium]|nr:general secretion pathway protein GspL [Burkholderiaceae bacterium]